jgi:predicted RNA-binding Zn-ribbon protein involved in translation (DUF1610 family)
LREPYAVAARQSLLWNETVEKAIDRIAAAGRCPTIGVELWRAKYALDTLSYLSARRGLMLYFMARYKSEKTETAERVVEQALHEHLSPVCERCMGVGELVTESLRVMCPECLGHRIRRYSDSERSRLMRMSFQQVRVLSHKLTWLMGEMGSWETSVNVIMNQELERL